MKKIIFLLLLIPAKLFAVCDATALPTPFTTELMPSSWAEVLTGGIKLTSATGSLYYDVTVTIFNGVTCTSAEVVNAQTGKKYCTQITADDSSTPDINEMQVRAVYAVSGILQCPEFYNLSLGQCVIADQLSCDAAAPLFCDDGFPADLLGYIGCDRPLLKQCSDSTIIIATDACNIVCGDRSTCEDFALLNTTCTTSQLPVFDYTNPDNWSMTCTDIDVSSPDNPVNGGNADGDIYNDPFSTPPTTTTADAAPTTTAGAIGTELEDDLANIERAIREQTTNDDLNTTDIVSSIIQASPDLTATEDILLSIDSKLDGINTGVNTAPVTGPCDSSQIDYLDCLKINNLPVHTSTLLTTDQALINFKDRVTASPVLVSFNNVSGMFNTTAGTCPPLSIDLPYPINATVSSTLFCDLITSNSMALASVMMVVWSFVAFRILAGA